MLFLTYALMVLHVFVGLILIGIVLLQRGRGGGLAGSFGGMGGQSAFGTKAGDVFTKITIGIAIVWFVLAGLCTLVANSATKGGRFKGGTTPVMKAPANDQDANQGQLGNADKESVKDDSETKPVPPSPDTRPAGTEESPDGAEKSQPKDENEGTGESDKKSGEKSETPASAKPEEPAPKSEKPQEEAAPEKSNSP